MHYGLIRVQHKDVLLADSPPKWTSAEPGMSRVPKNRARGKRLDDSHNDTLTTQQSGQTRVMLNHGMERNDNIFSPALVPLDTM